MPALLQITFIAAVIAAAAWLESLSFFGLMVLIICAGLANFLLFPFTRR